MEGVFWTTLLQSSDNFSFSRRHLSSRSHVAVDQVVLGAQGVRMAFRNQFCQAGSHCLLFSLRNRSTLFPTRSTRYRSFAMNWRECRLCLPTPWRATARSWMKRVGSMDSFQALRQEPLCTQNPCTTFRLFARCQHLRPHSLGSIQRLGAERHPLGSASHLQRRAASRAGANELFLCSASW